MKIFKANILFVLKAAIFGSMIFTFSGCVKQEASQVEENAKSPIATTNAASNAEIAAAREKNFQIVTLKGRILRAETAAVSVAAILQHRFGDLI